MTPDRPREGDAEGASEQRSRSQETAAGYRLSVFVPDDFPPTMAAVRRRLLRKRQDADIAIARFERALRKEPALGSAGPWAAPPERLHRGLRLQLDDDGTVDVVVEIETIARRLGLAILDEELEEISFPCALGARVHIEDAARALCAAGAGYLMIEGGPGDRYFVQAFAEAGCPKLRLEAVGNGGLERQWQLPRASVTELRRRGWRPPRGAELNHSATLPIAGPAAPGRIATLLGEALEMAYGLSKTSAVTICLSFDADRDPQ